jgi:hypothetical protein
MLYTTRQTTMSESSLARLSARAKVLPKAQQKDVVVVVAGRDATAVPKEDRGGRKGGGSWHGGDGRAACGCDCGGDISRCVLKKRHFVVSESVWSIEGGKSKSNNNVVVTAVRLAAAVPRHISTTPALNARARATTYRITAGESGGASVRSGDEPPTLHY